MSPTESSIDSGQSLPQCEFAPGMDVSSKAVDPLLELDPIDLVERVVNGLDPGDGLIGKRLVANGAGPEGTDVYKPPAWWI